MADEALEFKDKFLELREKYAGMKKILRGELAGKASLLEQNKALQTEISALRAETLSQKKTLEAQKKRLESGELEAHLPGRGPRREEAGGASESEALKNKLLRAENQAEGLRKDLEKLRKDQELILGQLRNCSSENLAMKARMELALNERAAAERRASAAEAAAEASANSATLAEARAAEGERAKAALLEKVASLEAKVLDPGSVNFVYSVRKKSLLGVEEMSLTLRRKIGGDIVMDFENTLGEIHTIRFRDIRSIEKSKKPGTIRIIERSIFNNVFEFEASDSVTLLADIKKYWLHFTTSPNGKLGIEPDVFDRIKTILFAD